MVNNVSTNITYYYCGKIGYWKKNYKNYLASLKQGASVASKGVYMIQTYFLLSASNSDTWILDTVYGSHICNSLQQLQNIIGLKRGDLKLFDTSGESISAKTMGTCMLKSILDKTLELEEYYYMPKIIRNIISISLLLK